MPQEAQKRCSLLQHLIKVGNQAIRSLRPYSLGNHHASLVLECNLLCGGKRSPQSNVDRQSCVAKTFRNPPAEAGGRHGKHWYAKAGGVSDSVLPCESTGNTGLKHASDLRL